jgi:hypothetical protein
VFTQSALRKIIAESQGIPRLINVLCDNALITGYGYQKKCITARVAEEVIADFKGERTPAPLSRFEVGFFAAVMLLFVAGALSLYLHGRNFLSTLEGVPQFSQQEKNVPHAAEQRGTSLSGNITGIAGESKPSVKKEIKGDR